MKGVKYNCIIDDKIKLPKTVSKSIRKLFKVEYE